MLLLASTCGVTRHRTGSNPKINQQIIKEKPLDDAASGFYLWGDQASHQLPPKIHLQMKTIKKPETTSYYEMISKTFLDVKIYYQTWHFKYSSK